MPAMSSEIHIDRAEQLDAGIRSVEMPRPTAAPLVLSLGLALLAAGVVTSLALLVVGPSIVARRTGHVDRAAAAGPRPRSRAAGSQPARCPASRAAAAERSSICVAGMPGYRLRLPEQVHPISAGVKGGIVGGLVMPLPALAYGVLSGHGIWYPVNLLAGMVLPGVDRLTRRRAGAVSTVAACWSAIVIHVVMSVVWA